MTILYCPLPSCDWSVLRPDLPYPEPELDRSMDALVAATWDMHVGRHGTGEIAIAVADATAGDRQGNTLFVRCLVVGCRWERDVDLSPRGFWASLFHVGTITEVESVYAERARHIGRHDVHTLARTLDHLTPKDTP